jgi:serine/threonine-protein kinase
MSPEQCLGERVDHRTDVFALGVVLYELTTGARCFQGKSDFARMLAVVRGEYTPPHQLVPDYPAELAAVVRRALAVSAADRYSSCAALIEALEGVLAARGWHGGTGAIARLVGELCGPGGAGRAATGADTDPTTSRISLPIEALATALASALALAAAPTAPRPVLGRGSARRLARGTSVEACDDRATRAPRALSHDDRAAPPPAEPPAGTTLRDALPRFAACAEGSLIEPLDDELEIPAGRSPGDPALEAAIDAAIDAASDAAASDAAASAPREAVRGAGAPARAQAERPPRLDTRGRPSPFDDDDEPTRGRRIAKRPGSVVV